MAGYVTFLSEQIFDILPSKFIWNVCNVASPGVHGFLSVTIPASVSSSPVPITTSSISAVPWRSGAGSGSCPEISTHVNNKVNTHNK